MARLVSIDPELLTHANGEIRRRTWFQVLSNCGWSRGTVLAENPNLRKLLSKVPDGTSSKEVQEFIIRAREKARTLQVPGLEGDSWLNRALGTSLVDYLLVHASTPGESEPRIAGIDRYFDQLAGVTDLYLLKDPKLLKSIDLLVIGSSRLDVIDKYQPLYALNPIFQHWIRVFGKDGEYRRHLTKKPILNLHVAHKDSDSARLAIQPGDSALDLLRRMKARDGSTAEQLTTIFDVRFRIWEPRALHSRFIIGNLGGIHLGESLNETGEVTVTPLSDHLSVQAKFDALAQGELFIRELQMPPLEPVLPSKALLP